MASREGFRKLLKRYGYQVDRVALDQQAAIMWAQLTPEQRVEVQREDYRARIWAGGFFQAEMNERMRMQTILQRVADRFDLYAIQSPLPGSLEELAAEVLGALGVVRNGEQL